MRTKENYSDTFTEIDKAPVPHTKRETVEEHKIRYRKRMQEELEADKALEEYLKYDYKPI